MLRLIILFCFVGSLYALTCPCHRWTEEERRTKCQPIQQCPAGVTRDHCGCCKVCAKDEGQVCGGPWHTSGRCGTGLKCKDLAQDIPIANLPKSICVKDDS